MIDEAICANSVPFQADGASVHEGTILGWVNGSVGCGDTGIDPHAPDGEVGTVASEITKEVEIRDKVGSNVFERLLYKVS